MINIFFGSSSGKVKLCKVSSLQDMCETFFRGGGGAFGNLKKTVKLFGIFFVQYQGYENYCKVVKGVQKL